MSGKIHHKVLSSNFHRSDIIEHAKKNGVQWEQDSHEGVNWMRVSHAIVNHVNEGKDFHTDHVDSDTHQKMLEHYTSLRDLHKKDMIPHIRSTVAKLYSESPNKQLSNQELVDMAHEHLDANGGHVWAEKMHTLRHLNTHIENLKNKLGQ